MSLSTQIAALATRVATEFNTLRGEVALKGATRLQAVNTDANCRLFAPGLIRTLFTEPIITLASGVTYYFGPFDNPSAVSIDRFVFKIQALTGTANVRLAMIPIVPSTLQPGPYTFALAELTYTTTGEKVATFTATSWPAGQFYIGMRTDNSTLALSGMRMQPISGWRGGEEGYVNYSHLTVSEAYGAFSTTPTAWTTIALQSTIGASGLPIPVTPGLA